MLNLIVKTLGPNTSDSYKATKVWLKNINKFYKIILYDSFEALFNELNIDDYIVMPLGYCNKSKKFMSSWVDYHFRFYKQLHIVDFFNKQTQKMVLLENVRFYKPGAVLQSATYQFFASEIKKKEKVKFVSSKSKAFEIFIKEGYHYTICSECVINNHLEYDNIKIIKEFNPVMFWVVYKFKKENENE